MMPLGTDEIINALRLPRGLLLEFFVAFSRFEYALKVCGFRKDPPADADVSWSKFKDWLDGRQSELSGVVEAGRYLIDQPPKRLVISDGAPSWEIPGRDGQSDIRFLLEGVVRSRNNLFHGGKWLTSPTLPERNAMVVEASVAVLTAILALPSSQCLRHAFEDVP